MRGIKGETLRHRSGIVLLLSTDSLRTLDRSFHKSKRYSKAEPWQLPNTSSIRSNFLRKTRSIKLVIHVRNTKWDPRVQGQSCHHLKDLFQDNDHLFERRGLFGIAARPIFLHGRNVKHGTLDRNQTMKTSADHPRSEESCKAAHSISKTFYPRESLFPLNPPAPADSKKSPSTWLSPQSPARPLPLPSSSIRPPASQDVWPHPRIHAHRQHRLLLHYHYNLKPQLRHPKFPFSPTLFSPSFHINELKENANPKHCQQ